MQWNWQKSDWPNLHWDRSQIAPAEERFLLGAGVAVGSIKHFGADERGGQWTKGKSCDTFNPLSPWLATPDEIADPANLSMGLSVNGESKQRGNTATMIFDPPFLIHYLSQFMTLEPGDLISTGTPPGVGLGFKPPQYLKAGDVVDLGIEGLAAQRQVFAGA
jgi:2-keto-4-pentenoate hydratase/2-oxohepta-3-ene-1,7-dioic acid hydratase in catechol pathway